MRPQLVLSILSLSLVVAACSSTTPTKPETSAASSSTATASASAAGTSVAASKKAGADPTVNADYLKRGYKPMKSKGEVLYCRSESLTGTKFKSTVCLTENQLKEQEENTREAGRELDRQRAPGCVAPPCS